MPGARERLLEIVCAHGIREDVAEAVVTARFADGTEPWGPLDTCAALADVLATVAREAPDDLLAAAPVVDLVASEIGLPAQAVAVVVGEQALADMARVLVPPLAALRGLLEILRVIGGVGGAAAWAVVDTDLALLCAVGDRGDTTVERCPLTDAGSNGTGDGAASAIVRHGDTVGFLTLPVADPSPRTRRLLAAASASAAAILDRWMLLERRAEAERLLMEAGERRLRRVGLDLHDGPLQGSAQLAGEMKLLRGQLTELDLSPETARKLQGRIDDLLARLVAVDDELRELAVGFESPVVLNTSLEIALAEEVAAFGSRHGKRTSFSLDGSLDELAPSHAVALYRMLQEALANVRQHSGARSVEVRVAARIDGVRSEIVDDGVGFDPAAISVSDGSRRHLGLAGMRERALLLGGTARVDSRPGGPTRVAISLPMAVPLPDLLGDLVRALGPAHEPGEESVTTRR
jgi:signal transduction histidine kinase